MTCINQSWVHILLQVPCVPVIPVLSVFINTYLMAQLEGETWVSYAVWMAIGKSVHFQPFQVTRIAIKYFYSSRFASL